MNYKRMLDVAGLSFCIAGIMLLMFGNDFTVPNVVWLSVLVFTTAGWGVFLLMFPGPASFGTKPKTKIDAAWCLAFMAWMAFVALGVTAAAIQTANRGFADPAGYVVVAAAVLATYRVAVPRMVFGANAASILRGRSIK